jgi:stearoyl-CoA desaturase (delta-9 desaturase)
MAASDWGLNVNENWQYFNSRLGIALSFVFPMLVFKTGFEWHWVVFSLLIHRVHVFGHSLCLHTYFSHKAFKTGRFIQFLLGFIAVGSHLGSPFQYSFLHQQLHHPRADKEGDPHSPVHGYWHAFLGWRFKDYVTSSTGQQLFRLKDIYQYADPAYKKAPEIRFLSKYCFFIQNLSFPLFYLLGMAVEAYIPQMQISALAFFVYFKVLPCTMSQFGLLSINVMGHAKWYGYRNFTSDDNSRNSNIGFFLWGSTCWHNNHHYMPTSAKTSFTPRETMIDIDYLIVLVLEKLGLVWDVKRPSQKMVDKGIMDGVVRPKKYQKGSEEKSDDDDQDEEPPQKMAG